MSNNSTVDAFVVKADDDQLDIIDADILDKYALKTSVGKDGSKQIGSDGWDYRQLLMPLYNPTQLCDLLELNTFHARCCDVVARDAAGFGYTVTPTEENKDKTENNKKIINNFINNLGMDLNQIFYRFNYDIRAMGYGAIEIIREGRSKSDILNLTHIPAQHLRRHKDGCRVQQQIGKKKVWFIIYGANYDVKGKPFDVHSETGKIHRYNSLKPEERANELFWGMDYTPRSQYYGLPKITPAIRTVHGDVNRSNYNSSFFKNYGMPTFALTVAGDFKGDLKPDDPGYNEKDTLKYKISQQLKEVIKNPHSAVTILVPSEGEEGNVEIKLQPLSVDTKEASFRIYRKDNRDEVLAAHGVPSYRIGINETGKLGGSNSEESTKIYKTGVIQPLKSLNEYFINTLIKDEFLINDYIFNISNLDQRDYLNDLEAAEKLFRMAAMTPRQLIDSFGERFGLKAVEDNHYLDEYFINNQPLSLIMESNSSGLDGLLNGLEDDLIKDAKVLDDDDSTNEEGAILSDGEEGSSNKRHYTSIADSIQKAFKTRR